jgi:hypothetical protein
MKNLIVLLTILMITTLAFGEKKPKVDPRDAQIDSLTVVTKNLSLKLDSITLELVKYLGVYDAIKEKVLHYNFDPTRTPYLIDSLKASRDSTMALLTVVPKTNVVTDSLVKINEVKIVIESASEIERAQAVSSLKQLKDLLDAKIITDAEFVALKSKYLSKL